MWCRRTPKPHAIEDASKGTAMPFTVLSCLEKRKKNGGKKQR